MSGQTKWISEVDRYLAEAEREGRTQLYEHEVYSILGALGIGTPVWHHIKTVEDISDNLLKRFPGDKVVLKIISPEIVHKERLGGVAIARRSTELVRAGYEDMVELFRESNASVVGVLLVEFVEYEPDPGSEFLVGIRESSEFGPFLALGKGGSDAEFFASEFREPDIFLLPIDCDEARSRLLHSSFGRAMRQKGNDGALEQMAKLINTLGSLSAVCSDHLSGGSIFALKELEINPLIVGADGRPIALDGHGVFDRKGFPLWDRRPANSPNLEALFSPKGVAVVGVSSGDHLKAGNIIVGNLTRLGREDVYCVNPRGGTVLEGGKEFRLYPNLADLPVAPELVVITIPAEATLNVVQEAVERGVKAVIIISGGFSESSGNLGLEEKIRSAVEGSGMRILGPNCLGVIYSDSDEPGMNTFFIPEEKIAIPLGVHGGIAEFTQSGALGLVTLANWSRTPPRVVVSFGNQLDITPADLVRYFIRDPSIRVIGIYVEGIPEGTGRRLLEAASDTSIPIVVYKAGRTEEGRIATQSHTAALAGDYRAANSAMEQGGVVVASTIDEYSGVVKGFAMLYGKSMGSGRVAVVTNAGYEKTNVADNLHGLTLATLDEATLASLNSLVPPMVAPDPLLDLTPMASDRVYLECVEVLLNSPAVDAVCLSIVPYAQPIHTTDAEIDSFSDNIANGAVALAERSGKPIVASIPTSADGGVFRSLVELLESGGIPVYRGAEESMRTLWAIFQQQSGCSQK